MSAPIPGPTFDSVEEALRYAHQEGTWDPYKSMARILAAAGAVSEWDSETIEHVLSHATAATDGARLPWVGNTGEDGAAHLFWACVAQAASWEHDWPYECEECHVLLADDALTTHLTTNHSDGLEEDLR